MIICKLNLVVRKQRLTVHYEPIISLSRTYCITFSLFTVHTPTKLDIVVCVNLQNLNWCHCTYNRHLKIWMEMDSRHIFVVVILHISWNFSNCFLDLDSSRSSPTAVAWHPHQQSVIVIGKTFHPGIKWHRNCTGSLCVLLIDCCFLGLRRRVGQSDCEGLPRNQACERGDHPHPQSQPACLFYTQVTITPPPGLLFWPHQMCLLHNSNSVIFLPPARPC